MGWLLFLLSHLHAWLGWWWWFSCPLFPLLSPNTSRGRAQGFLRTHHRDFSVHSLRGWRLSSLCDATEQTIKEKLCEGVFPPFSRKRDSPAPLVQNAGVLVQVKLQGSPLPCLLGTRSHACSAAAGRALTQLAFYFFPPFFLRFLEMFSALAGRDLAPNTVVTIKNNI